MLMSMGVPRSEISNGLDWESYYNFEARLQEQQKNRPIEEIRWSDLWNNSYYQAVVSFAPRNLSPKFEQVGQVPYWTPLSWKTEYLYLWRLRRPAA